MSKANLLLAGGGTAGHIEPALAVARAWKAKHPEARITFVGTSAGLETTLVPQAGFTLSLIPKVAISRSLNISLLRVPVDLVRSVIVSRKLLREADVAIGFGGYVSAPIYIASRMTGTPLVIHEQNAVPGWANKLGARFTRLIALSYPVSGGALSRGELTGLPLRADVLDSIRKIGGQWESARKSAKAELARAYGLSEKDPIIFIFGGSQGSQAINKVIAESLPIFAQSNLNVIHSVGSRNALPQAQAGYAPTHYITNMAEHYLGADLIIARSGAVSCAEISALGKFALFIPLPIGNGEQAKNAATLVSDGRAEIIEQTSFNKSWLEENVKRLIGRSQSATAAGDISSITAIDKIVSMIEKALIG